MSRRLTSKPPRDSFRRVYSDLRKQTRGWQENSDHWNLLYLERQRTSFWSKDHCVIGQDDFPRAQRGKKNGELIYFGHGCEAGQPFSRSTLTYFLLCFLVPREKEVPLPGQLGSLRNQVYSDLCWRCPALSQHIHFPRCFDRLVSRNSRNSEQAFLVPYVQVALGKCSLMGSGSREVLRLPSS